MSVTVFIEMYHPALPGTPHVLAPVQAEDLYAAKGWLVVDGATPVSAAEFITPLAGDLRYVQHWQPSLAVTATQVFVAPDAHLIQRIADGTTRPTYDATEQALWTIVSGGGGAVSSVAGRTGVVVLSTSDISGLGSAATQASSAFDTAGAAAAAQAASLPLQRIAATVTTAGALVSNKHNPVDATAGTKAMTLPTGQAEGATISVEKTDASVNTVTVTGNIRGVGSTTLSLVWQNEDLVLRADSAGSWWPVSGHKTKASLDAVYAPSSVKPTGAAAPEQIVYTSATFNSVVDPILKIGYNADGTTAAEPVIRFCIEGNYKTSATDPNTQWVDSLVHNTSEVYLEYQSPDKTSVTAYRPLYLGITRDDNTSQSAIITFDVGTKGFPLSQFNIKAGATNLLGISASSFFLGAIPLTMEAVGAQFRSTAAADSAADFFGNSTKQWCWSLKTPNGSGDFIFMDPRNSFRSHIALTGGASNTAALSTFNSSVKVNGNFGINGNTPVGKAGAIATPTSDTVGTKNAIDSIRAALTAVGITA